MKKSLLSLLAIFIIISIFSYSIAKTFETRNNSNKTHTIVSSFYPEYVILLNLLDNCDDINIKNMTASATGCLHDYQITSSDMKILENADSLVINGGGMEPFLDDITKAYPKLHVIDSSKNIKLLKNISTHNHDSSNVNNDKFILNTCEEDHKHTKECAESEDEHVHSAECEHGQFNAHIWLNPSNYLKQITNIAHELSTIYPEYKDIINNNSSLYTKKIKKLQSDISIVNKKIKKRDKKDIIIFHDSFAYIANSFNLNVVQCIEVESDSSLSAGTIANTIDEINHHNIEILLSEKQFKNTIANNIANETDAKVYILDSLVTGSNTKDSYIKGMKKNIATIENILIK